MDLQGMFEKIMPKQTPDPADDRAPRPGRSCSQQEIEALIDPEKINQAAVDADRGVGHRLHRRDRQDRRRRGLERAARTSRARASSATCLPIVEGTTVNTKYGPVKTDHVLFIAAGAFHRSKPSDLMPELQGRFPIRVEMHDLTRDDFARILREPRASLIRQYQALLGDRGHRRSSSPPTPSRPWPTWPSRSTASTQNIGARRLHTILERVLEDISFDAPDRTDKRVVVDDDARPRAARGPVEGRRPEPVHPLSNERPGRFRPCPT